MDFLNENLLPGQLGHFFIILAFLASIAATFSYFRATTVPFETDRIHWKKLARIFFIAQVISVVAVFGLLIFIISNHLFEYKYAWQHSSRSLEANYLLSSIWEGQEGSFLLWSLWHCVLGLVVIKKGKQWEAPVMSVVSFVQFCLAIMVLGLHFFDLKVGSNPFVLLRNEMAAPIFSEANYLTFITDGNDLNPLLQNYWMVIHPPVLFLGFASVTFPFAYAIAGLWTKNYRDWTKPALSWGLFSAGVLGLGIMMGARWAYESLTFGGYWAWDPVENASLVPWLTLVAGIHTMVIFRSTGNALRSSFLFLILSFLLIFYSTYLTRSGVLQDTSVHAFNPDSAVEIQLRLFLFLFIIGSLTLLAVRYKHIPFVAKEEQASSREFWMFIGSLVLLLSAVTIIAMTSVPVLNRIVAAFGGGEVMKPLAFGEDTEFAYNRIQIFVAVILGVLTAVTQYLKYKSTARSSFLKKIMWPSLAAFVIAALILAFGNINYDTYGIGYLGAIWLAITGAVYAVIANASYIWVGLKGKMAAAGGSIAHVGFSLMLVGILISSSKKETLSVNTSGIFVNFGEESKEKPGENLTLVRGVKNNMGDYFVTYVKDSAHPKKQLWYYHLKFERKDGKEEFVLTPNAFVNYKGNEGLMANPDAKHYWNYDVFTYITSLPDPEKAKDTAQFRTVEVAVGDTFFFSKGFGVLEKLTTKGNIPNPAFAPEDSASVATIKIITNQQSIYTIEPLMIKTEGQSVPYPDTLQAANMVVQLQNVNGGLAEIGVKESDNLMQYVTLKAYKFPFINLLWMGTIIMVIGFGMSSYKRIRMKNTPSLKL